MALTGAPPVVTACRKAAMLGDITGDIVGAVQSVPTQAHSSDIRMIHVPDTRSDASKGFVISLPEGAKLYHSATANGHKRKRASRMLLVRGAETPHWTGAWNDDVSVRGGSSGNTILFANNTNRSEHLIIIRAQFGKLIRQSNAFEGT